MLSRLDPSLPCPYCSHEPTTLRPGCHHHALADFGSFCLLPPLCSFLLVSLSSPHPFICLLLFFYVDPSQKSFLPCFDSRVAYFHLLVALKGIEEVLTYMT